MKRLFFFFAGVVLASNLWGDPLTLNEPGDGFRGLWYQREHLDSEYLYKYSGGLGTYCAKHQPFAVYSPEVDKTFFCYGGVDESYLSDNDLTLENLDRDEVENGIRHMVSAFDHKTGKVQRPTVLVNKRTMDAHDNPVISIDDSGYLWVLSTAHGKSRPSYVHRSVRPWDATEFEWVQPYRMEEGDRSDVTNFSYMQVWNRGERGFVYFFTLYDKGERKTLFARSDDGLYWENWVRLADIEKGHYQISGVYGEKAASAFNFHPQDKGLNARTNLYYVQTIDDGDTWTSVAGDELEMPLTDVSNSALVHDFRSEGLLVYLKDIAFDDEGRPLILFVTSLGFESGPENGPRVWRLARWTGNEWRLSEIAESDNNYDMGSLYWENGVISVIAPALKGPQSYNPGGEVGMWTSRDGGVSWELDKTLTESSSRNHTYVRRPVNAHPGFYGFWADGHAREPSISRLYFSDRDGAVYQLPERMRSLWKKPRRLSAPAR